MKYCVTLQLRSFLDDSFIPFLESRYYVANSVQDLNDWLHHHVCNTRKTSEIINLFFEVVKELNDD